jgi:hypothetical protein
MRIYSLYSGNKRSEIVLDSTFKDNPYEFALGELSTTEPIKTKITMGKKQYDFLIFNDGANFVISDKLFKLLKTHNVTGWKTYPVSIKGVKENYYGVQITGRAGKLTEDHTSDTEIKFDHSTWDGSDIFSPKGTNLRLLTPRVKELLEENDITNVDIEIT